MLNKIQPPSCEWVWDEEEQIRVKQDCGSPYCPKSDQYDRSTRN